MKILLIVFALLCMLPSGAFATYVAVLETAADGGAKDSVPFLDRQYLTNVLREQAVKELPAVQNYTIMTRENIQQMLPPSKSIEDCEGSCLVETGKNIAADYVCQARVGRFGNSLTLSAELYETAGNKLIASFNGRGSDVNELLAVIEAKSPEFFQSVKELEMFKRGKAETSVVKEAMAVVEEKMVVADTNVAPLPDSTQVNVPVVVEEPIASKTETVGENKIGESIPVNVDKNTLEKNKETSSKQGGIHWLPLSISAVATVTGVVLTVVGNSNAKSAANRDWNSMGDLEKNKDSAKKGQFVRNFGLGIALVGTVGLCLSVVF